MDRLPDDVLAMVMSLLSVPDDVLAMVMSLLTVPDVFSCRLVCKKLAGVALHPDVWRHRRVSSDTVDDNRLSYTDQCRLRCPVLRLAPCLRGLEALVPSARSPTPRCHQPFAATCAVRDLVLTVVPGGAIQAALLIKQFEALGRLRTLSCHIYRFTGSPVFAGDDLPILLGILASTSGLDELHLTGDKFDTCYERGLDIRFTATPSLKSFTCALTKDTERFCNFMLAAHAPTLEAVGLETDNYPDSPIPVPVSLLAGMPNLRRLSSRLVPGLEDVAAACMSLRELKLYVDRDSEVHWTSRTEDGGTTGAVELLRRSEQLRSVHLVFPRDNDSTEEYDHVSEDMGAVLLEALAGLRQLETLVFEILGGYHNFSPQQDLLQALPSLPALRRLSVNMDPDELLGAISSAIAPSLRSFRVQEFSTPKWEEEPNKMCAHALMHSPSLRALMSDMPMLHVEIEYGVCTYADDALFDGAEEVCECDLLSCHRGLGNLIKSTTNQSYLGIFAHPEDQCPSPEHHAANIHWIHIDKV